MESASLSASLNNEVRKQLYTKLELALLDAEGTATIDSDGTVLNVDLQERLVKLRKALRLVPLDRPFRVWYWLDIWFRFVGVCCGFFTISLLSLPTIALQVRVCVYMGVPLSLFFVHFPLCLTSISLSLNLLQLHLHLHKHPSLPITVPCPVRWSTTPSAPTHSTASPNTCASSLPGSCWY